MVPMFSASRIIKSSLFLLLAGGIISFNSCKKDDESATESVPLTPYSIDIPHGFPEPYLNADNPMTVEGIDMGHHFYYDPILSENGMRCTSCHLPSRSFSGLPYNTPAGDDIDIPPHVNLAWNPDYDWDGGIHMLDSLPLGDFAPQFFNTNMMALRQRLTASDYYSEMFKKVYHVTNFYSLTDDQLKMDIVKTIAQYLRSMVSANSKYDRYKLDHSVFTPSELNGYLIFMTEKGDCFHCHGDPLFTINQNKNNGLECNPTGINQGAYLITGIETDKGKFSVPTLRNIEFTAPYMHDGRFQTLEEVVEFYNSGVCQSSPNIDPIMTKPAKIYGLQLFDWEKADLVAFLKTLSDTTFMNNPNFANPF